MIFCMKLMELNMATRRYSRNVLPNGSQIVRSEVDYSGGLTFQFRITTGSYPSLVAFSCQSTSTQALLLELNHFINRASRILRNECALVDEFDDNTIF